MSAETLALISGLSSSEKAELDKLLATELVRIIDASKFPHDWTPRYYQQKIWDYLEDGGKRACLIWHRRSGKDDIALNWAAKAAHLRVGEYWHMLPEASQARKAIWDAVSPHTGTRRIDQAFPVESRANTRKNDMVIEFKNGSLWRVVGSDNYDSLLGSTPAGIVFSEWALADPNAWAFLRPILVENNGWALFITTPRGSNHAAKTYNLARNDPTWFAQVLSAKDTGVFTAAQLENELKEYQNDYGKDEGEAFFEQEYNCSFEAALVGSYYGSYLNRAVKEGRIGKVPIDRSVLVHTGWDLGVSDSTGIWFIQRAGREYRLVDYYEAAGVGLDEYARVLDEKRAEHRWVYGMHYFPHDMAVRELSNGGRSRADTMKNLGYRPIIVSQSSVMDGVNATRKLLDQCWIDETRCERGLNALRNYRREWDERLKMFRDNPLHDWACVTEETLVLTRNGTQRISDLPNKGEVLTPCGWKQYHSPRITRKNAPLVAVTFADGLTVNCTPEHLFLTDSGWRFAESLQIGSMIQSSLTKERSILMGSYIVFGQVKNIIHVAADAFISMFGKRPLGNALKASTFTIEMIQQYITGLKTWNACRSENILALLGIIAPRVALPQVSINWREIRPLSGINRQKVLSGIDDTQNVLKVGLSGKGKNVIAFTAIKNFLASFAAMVTNKNIAAQFAKQPLIISAVKNLNKQADVWCLTVDDGHWWTLANGAVTHNSHGSDALRTFASGYRDPKEKPVRIAPIPSFETAIPNERGTGWMGR